MGTNFHGGHQMATAHKTVLHALHPTLTFTALSLQTAPYWALGAGKEGTHCANLRPSPLQINLSFLRMELGSCSQKEVPVHSVGLAPRKVGLGLQLLAQNPLASRVLGFSEK